MLTIISYSQIDWTHTHLYWQKFATDSNLSSYNVYLVCTHNEWITKTNVIEIEGACTLGQNPGIANLLFQ